MTSEEWSELYDKLEIMEDYFKEVLRKAVNFKAFGTTTQKHNIAVNAKQIEKGTIGLLKSIGEIKELAFQGSGAVRIPVKIIYDNKPQLTILEGGVFNDYASSDSAPSNGSCNEPVASVLSPSKIDGT
jgi:hypothetical protein